ncbi:MAG: MBL fold metallo-hydrolase [Lentisphaeria bacterium]|jgi:hydroxyacylglutathione hydrolase
MTRRDALQREPSAMTEIHSFTVGLLSVNCYLLYHPESRECLIVDPGDHGDKIQAELRKLSLQPRGILLTHGHVDHISAVPAIAKAYDIPVWIHQADRGLYSNPDNAILPWISAAKDLPEPCDTPPQIAGINYEIIHTPGHSPGCVCFYFPAEQFLLSGDTLFRGTVGRTDFPGGSTAQLMASIKNKLLVLPDRTTVYPGHEAPTSIARERPNFID